MKLVERMPRVCKAVIKAKGGCFEESQIYHIFRFFKTLFWLLHVFMCYFIIFMSSLLFYNVENSNNKKTLNHLVCLNLGVWFSIRDSCLSLSLIGNHT